MNNTKLKLHTIHNQINNILFITYAMSKRKPKTHRWLTACMFFCVRTAFCDKSLTIILFVSGKFTLRYELINIVKFIMPWFCKLHLYALATFSTSLCYLQDIHRDVLYYFYGILIFDLYDILILPNILLRIDVIFYHQS